MKILTDLHTHTSANTHAYSTLLENAKHAEEIGLELIAMTNHGPAVPDGAHEFHFWNMDIIPREIHGVTILRGIEANVMDIEGTLDIYKLNIPKIELVLATIHEIETIESHIFNPKNEKEFIKVYENLAKNPLVDIIGHINRTPFVSNLDYVIPMLNENGKVIEINPQCSTPKRKQELMNLIDICLRHKVNIAVSSDAHFCQGVGDFQGIDNYLTEIGYPEELVINRNKESVLQWLSQKKG